jgi:hypothetical protein
VDDLLYFNGIDAASGDYLLPPIPPETFSRLLQNTSLDEKEIAELKAWFFKKDRPHLGLKEGDPNDLAQAGWGVIFPADADPSLRAALRELLDWRQEGATRQYAGYYHEFSGDQGYQAGESKLDWLARHGLGPGPVEPDKVPYYLLIVGDPQAIPYRFQTQLDIQYATGRLHFDRLEDYTAYAHSVVTAEKSALARRRAITFFGVSNPDDPATRLSAAELMHPLAQDTAQDHPSFLVQSIPPDEARKNRLASLMGGEETPALLFTASHGMSFPIGHPLQYRRQGALLTQDWPGPKAFQGAIPEDFYFSADDLPDDAHVYGMLAFLFACYGAGTPQFDEFAQAAFKDQRAALAPQAFLAGLPKRLLAHPRGSALAVIGHVDRAWGYSFYWSKARRQLAVFESALSLLLRGYPVGAALDPFNIRYAELSTELTQFLEDIQFGRRFEPRELAGMWTANNDARNYIIAGDPAVRLMIAAPGAVSTPNPEVATLMPLTTPSSPPEEVINQTTLSYQSQEILAAIHAQGRFYSAALDHSYLFPQAERFDIGRRDPASGKYPAIDLSNQGAVSASVSRQHARITLAGGEILIEDLESRNHTELNGQRLVPRQQYSLHHGDVVKLGGVLLIYLAY